MGQFVLVTVREIRPRHEFQSGTAKCASNIGEMIVIRDDREALRTRSRRKIRKDRCARDVAETATDLDVQVPATGNFRIGVHAIDEAPG